MSERKTLIFGNGLGMALDSEFFRLERSIKEVWNDGELLDDDQRDLISRCLTKPPGSAPESEDELPHLQVALDACETFESLPRGADRWLTSEAKAFPEAVRRFLHGVACGFHSKRPEHVLPAGFLDPLIEFVRLTKSHVATLNYDSLLYRPMIDAGLLADTYSKTTLVDGMLTVKGFRSENLDRKPGLNFGYYLHLHGSPLYVVGVARDMAKISKLSLGSLSPVAKGAGRHLVLTHFKHKPAVIDRSVVLSAYWNKLAEALQESSEVVLVGLSGLDKHLNRMIRNAGCERARVIEWEGAGTKAARQCFWQQELTGPKKGLHLQVIQLPSILSFADWAAE